MNRPYKLSWFFRVLFSIMVVKSCSSFVFVLRVMSRDSLSYSPFRRGAYHYVFGSSAGVLGAASDPW